MSPSLADRGLKVGVAPRIAVGRYRDPPVLGLDDPRQPLQVRPEHVRAEHGDQPGLEHVPSASPVSSLPPGQRPVHPLPAGFLGAGSQPPLLPGIPGHRLQPRQQPERPGPPRIVRVLVGASQRRAVQAFRDLLRTGAGGRPGLRYRTGQELGPEPSQRLAGKGCGRLPLTDGLRSGCLLRKLSPDGHEGPRTGCAETRGCNPEPAAEAPGRACWPVAGGRPGCWR
jgi:hypothetical protein